MGRGNDAVTFVTHGEQGHEPNDNQGTHKTVPAETGSQEPPQDKRSEDVNKEDTGHALTTQGGGSCGSCRHGASGCGWHPPQCYSCGAIGHIASHCLESLEDAQCMLQEAQQQGGVRTSTQSFMTGVTKAADVDPKTAWKFIQDHRRVER